LAKATLIFPLKMFILMDFYVNITKHYSAFDIHLMYGKAK